MAVYHVDLYKNTCNTVYMGDGTMVINSYKNKHVVKETHSIR